MNMLDIVAVLRRHMRRHHRIQYSHGNQVCPQCGLGSVLLPICYGLAYSGFDIFFQFHSLLRHFLFPFRFSGTAKYCCVPCPGFQLLSSAPYSAFFRYRNGQKRLFLPNLP